MTVNVERLLLLLGILATASLSACGANVTSTGGSGAQGVAVEVHPPAVQLKPGTSLDFGATVTGTANTAVNWTVVEPGGGTVDASGLYVAPQATGTFHVVARSSVDSTASATASVLVSPTAVAGGTSACPALRAAGTKRYFCDCGTGANADCINHQGNDSNDGLTASNPRRTWAAVTADFNSMAAGDTVLLCRGGAWDSVAALLSPVCSAGSPCDMRDYVPAGYNGPQSDGGWGQFYDAGSDDRPRINSGGGRTMDMTGSYMQFVNLRVVGSAFNGNDFGYLHNTTGSNNTVCNNVVDSFDVGMIGGYLQGPGFTVAGNRFTNNAADAILMVGSNSVIRDNYFDNNGHNVTGGIARTHTVYLGSATGPFTNVQFINNEIRRSNMSGGSNGTGDCNGPPVVLHGEAEDVTLANNYFDVRNGNTGAGGCWNVMVSTGGYPAGCGYARIKIQNNQFHNMGSLGIQLEACQDCVVENNTFDWSTGILIDYGGLGCTCGSCIYQSTRGVVRNNTAYIPASATDAYDGIKIVNGTGDSGTGYLVENNAVSYLGTGGSGFACFNMAVGAGALAKFDYNLCHTPNGGSAERSGIGLGPNSFTSDPQFANPSSDLSPAAGSPLIGHADNSSTCTVAGVGGQPCYAPLAIGTKPWSASDTGTPRTSSPSIGAYQP